MSASAKLHLPPPTAGHVDVLIVAAEHSGDEHASRMVRELRQRRPELAVAALGGPRLAAAGAQLLRDLTASSVMGFAVIRKMPFYRALIAEIVRWIGEHRPRAVCFVDSSGLNLRIARGLFEKRFSAKAGGPTKALYYISPQVWASRGGRRFQMAKHLDGLAAIFPFESKVYADTNLPVEFVGHPFVAPDYAPPVSYDPDGPVLLLPGSRRGLVSRLFPVLLESFREFGGSREAVVLYPSEEILAVLRTATLPKNVTLTRIDEGRARIPLRAGEDCPTSPAASGVALPTDSIALPASAVLTSSGTMSMHCALAGIPGAVTYRTDPLTYFLGRLIVKVKYIGIANLLLGEPMYPEYVQGAATPRALADELRACLEDPSRRQRTVEQAERLRALLHREVKESAAQWLARQIG